MDNANNSPKGEGAKKRPAGRQLSGEDKEKRAARKELALIRMRMSILSETIKNTMKERAELKAKSTALAAELGMKPRGRRAGEADSPEAS